MLNETERKHANKVIITNYLTMRQVQESWMRVVLYIIKHLSNEFDKYNEELKEVRQEIINKVGLSGGKMF